MDDLNVIDRTDHCPDADGSHCTHWTPLGEECCGCDGIEPHGIVADLLARLDAAEQRAAAAEAALAAGRSCC